MFFYHSPWQIFCCNSIWRRKGAITLKGVLSLSYDQTSQAHLEPHQCDPQAAASSKVTIARIINIAHINNIATPMTSYTSPYV